MRKTMSRNSVAYIRLRAGVIVALGFVGLGILLAAASWADTQLHGEPTPPGCATEDATSSCVCHADQHGDGVGRSLTVSDDGTVRYF